ncbi:retinoic acid induced 1/transcription factor 20 [Holotrichia oblita]|uniref:Retinoic acid induced 1/transcription factor 20 n=1 Tax=Holotrichia oblita TaxID=644536 RepID=A0ACB9SMD8_HOLOL|nr:retinoic acid induced 1/transcription factor 20 [Holotrichia oblita]
MSGGPPHHSHGRQVPPSNAAWNRLQVPNYYPRQPQLAHMSNEHPLLHQPTWHTPTTEPMKTIPHPHMFNLEQMLQERSYPRSGVDLTLTRNGSQNGDLPTTPISLSVRDTNKINSLPASALEIQAVELKTPVMKSLSPGLKSTSPGVKPLSPAISTSPGLMERQGSPKSSKKPPKRMDSILERLNSQPPQSETNPTEKSNSEVSSEKSAEKTVQPIQSVIVQPSNSIHDENSNSSSILNVPTPTNLREEEVTSPYSNDDSLDSNKSRRKRKPSKTIRLTKESDKAPELTEDPLKLDTVVKETVSTNIETEPIATTESAKSSDEGNEPERERPASRSSDTSPAAKKTRRKTSSESETIAKIAAMVQEVVNESTTVESQNEDTLNKAVSVSVIRDTTKELQTSSNSIESESSDKTTSDKLDEDPLVVTPQDLPCTTIITPAQRKATNFVEVENKLEEMFAGIEESSTTPKVDPLEIDCEKIDDFINDSKDETDSRFDGPSTSQNDVSSTSNDLLNLDKSSPKKARVARRKTNNTYDKKKKGKKSVNGKQIKTNAIKDIYAYDSGSNTSSVKSKGPFIQIKGPRDSPISVSIVNTAIEDETEKKSNKNKKFHDDSEYRHKVRSKGLHCSTLSNKYDAQTKDVSWICVFCKRGPHSTDPNVRGPSIFSAQVLPPGDLFGPYVITSNCPEYERRLDDPYDKQFKSKKIARVLDASSSSNVQMKVSGKKSKRKHSESDRSFNELDVNDPNLGITETGEKTFEIWVHEDCVVWSPGVYLVGPKIIGLEEAVWTSCNVPCARCGFKGANVCCLKRGCTNVMHFGCAVASNWQLTCDNYTALCIAHKSV